MDWNIVTKRKSREKSRSRKAEEENLPTILKRASDHELSCSSADDEDWRSGSLSPSPSPLLLALIKPSYQNHGGSSHVEARTQTKYRHRPAVKPPIRTNSDCWRAGADVADTEDNATLCSFSMKLDNITDKVSQALLQVTLTTSTYNYLLHYVFQDKT